MRARVSNTREELVERIIASGPGAQLPTQDQLARELDVSRTVLREAVAMLLTRNMLDIRSRIGTHILPVDDWLICNDDVIRWRLRLEGANRFLLEVTELRSLIEPQAAAQAAMRYQNTDPCAIRDAFDAFAACHPGSPEALAADQTLHTRIIEASGNVLFGQMTAFTRGMLAVAHGRDAYGSHGWTATVQLRRTLVEAIERRDSSVAQAASCAVIAQTAAHCGSTMPLKLCQES